MIEIPLSKTGKLAGLYTTIISDEDEILADYNWNRSPDNHVRRTAFSDETNASGNRKTIYLHRAVMERFLGRKLSQKEQVDHINLDGFDNRRENLRVATHSENLANRKAQKRNSSGYKGVAFHKWTGKWQAIVSFNKTRFHVGTFETPEKAYEEWCKKAKEIQGKFARTD